MTSSATTNKKQTGALARTLPERAHTRSGIGFNPNDDLWHWVDGVFRIRLDFSRLSMAATFPIASLKYTLHVFVKLNAPTYAGNLFNAFVHFFALRDGQAPLKSVSVAEVSNYAARLQEHEKWRLGHLNVLLQKWHALDLPGVEAECVQYLRERRKPGNVKGAAVRQRDPVDGPFSEEEYITLYKAVDAAYGTGAIPRWIIVLFRLLFVAGGRISQYASLKLKDLDGSTGKFVLRLPRVKTGLEHSRASFLTFDLSPQTGRLVMEHIESQRIAGRDAAAPLFPVADVLTRGAREQLRGKDDMFYGHCTRDQLSHTFSRILSEIAPATPRLDYEQMPVSPKRFRPTFGTRLVDEGASRTVVAHLLGHVDLQNVDVYFEQSPTGLSNMNKAMVPNLAPVARCFQGRLIDGEEQATQKDVPGNTIIDFRVSTKGLASCAGSTQSCAFDKPVACYTCFRFEPWLDGPHEAVLARLEQERKKWSADPKMATINDAAIIAVKEVIAECAMVRTQRAEGSTS